MLTIFKRKNITFTARPPVHWKYQSGRLFPFYLHSLPSHKTWWANRLSCLHTHTFHRAFVIEFHLIPRGLHQLWWWGNSEIKMKKKVLSSASGKKRGKKDVPATLSAEFCERRETPSPLESLHWYSPWSDCWGGWWIIWNDEKSKRRLFVCLCVPGVRRRVARACLPSWRRGSHLAATPPAHSAPRGCHWPATRPTSPPRGRRRRMAAPGACPWRRPPTALARWQTRDQLQPLQLSKKNTSAWQISIFCTQN